MAGDWIKWEHGLIDKPEVFRMSVFLHSTKEVIVCRLMKFWEWCDSNIPESAIHEDGSAYVTLSPRDGDNMAYIDALVGLELFAASLADAGWIRFRGGRIELPNFGRHNGETAKTRARNAKNQKRLRGKTNGNIPPPHGGIKDDDVTKMSSQNGDKTVTRGEESREEEKKEPPNPQRGKGLKPRWSESETPIPPELDTPDFRAVWESWILARDEQKKPVSQTAAKQQFAELVKIGIVNAIACIRHSIANQYQGLLPEKFTGTTRVPTQFKTKRELDNEFMAKQMADAFPQGGNTT